MNVKQGEKGWDEKSFRSLKKLFSKWLDWQPQQTIESYRWTRSSVHIYLLNKHKNDSFESLFSSIVPIHCPISPLRKIEI